MQAIAEAEEVMRGHLDECFADFVQRFGAVLTKGSRGATEAKRPMAEFCGVDVSAVVRWFHHEGQLPKGETAVKLLCFLHMNGYRLVELERLPSPQRKFIELIGFGVISMQQAAEILSYASSAGVYHVLRGESEPGPGKEEKMWDIFKLNKAELEKKKAEFSRKYPCMIELARRSAVVEPPKQETGGQKIVQQETVEPEAVTPELVEEAQPDAIARPGFWSKATGAAMDCLLTLMKRGLENRTKAERDADMAELRRTHGNTILELTARLSALSLSSQTFSSQRSKES